MKRPATWLALTIALPAAAVIAGVLLSWLHTDTGLLTHLGRFVLPRVVGNTLVLVIGVAALTSVIGVALAWLTAMYEFPGRRLFSWALLLPMAMPGYVIGFVFIGVFEYSGPLQGLLRSLTGTTESLIPIRSTPGIIIVMSLALYPYVYLMARNAFLTQGQRAIEVAATLGLAPRAAFWRVALPLARPWIAGGVLLVSMETLADFGTVSVFNYDTFTTAIYQAWFGLYSLTSALQLASVLLLIVFVVLIGEKKLRGRAGYATGVSAARVRPLEGSQRWLASAACLTVLAIGFGLPVVQLVAWTVTSWSAAYWTDFLRSGGQSLLVALLAMSLTTAAAIGLVYARRAAPSPLVGAAVRVGTLGYALPGTILAVAIYSLLAASNNALNTVVERLLGIDPGFFVQGTLLAMLIALGVRFLAVAFQSVSNAMRRVSPHIDEASRSLGVTGMPLVRLVYLPLLRGGVLTASVLVFVDVMKEMPITLMTRPFGWDTLAVRVFEMTSEGQWERAALPALAIAIVGLVPVIFIVRAASNAPATR
ncbi:MAG: iron ABC transporter permease [Gammaproteobacteria bacterium]|nr:iron ABC transporter permease [Gammaproteobacteria bacterium]NND60779.1 iron ABC transporter permease [Gammaproteobacteria bacterium]